jgi:hypothetical protein
LYLFTVIFASRVVLAARSGTLAACLAPG